MSTAQLRVSPARLRQAYQESRFTSQADLATAVGLHFTTVNKHLRGKTRVDDIGVLSRYAEQTGKSLDFFLVSNGDGEEADEDEEEAEPMPDSDLARDLAFLASFKTWVSRNGVRV